MVYCIINQIPQRTSRDSCIPIPCIWNSGSVQYEVFLCYTTAFNTVNYATDHRSVNNKAHLHLISHCDYVNVSNFIMPKNSSLQKYYISTTLTMVRRSMLIQLDGTPLVIGLIMLLLWHYQHLQMYSSKKYYIIAPPYHLRGLGGGGVISVILMKTTLSKITIFCVMCCMIRRIC